MRTFKKRVVVKVGSNVLTNSNNRIVEPILRNVVRQIAYLYEHDIITILVTSGAAIAGKEILGEISQQNKSVRRQVYSSVGQPRLMRHYYSMFHQYGLCCAQVLATKNDFSEGLHRDNMINCYEGLLQEGIIPIANEDDAVSLSMSMFTDNDELASLVSSLVNADMMILLTDIDGLYTGNPNDDNSELLEEVAIHENVEQYIQASNKKEGEGRGGMQSKVRIAKQTALLNIPTIIANGKNENTIIDIVVNKEGIGTQFVA